MLRLRLFYSQIQQILLHIVRQISIKVRFYKVFLILIVIYILVYNATDSLSRNLIQQMDRDPNHGLNLQSHENERQLSRMTMSDLSNRIVPSSAGNNENHPTQQDQDPSSDNMQSVNTY